MTKVSKKQKKPDLQSEQGRLNNFNRMLSSAKNEDFLGIVIRGHLVLEATMRTMLETALLYAPPEELFSRGLNLRLRTEMCVALGLMEKAWIAPIKAVIDLRNEFAHTPTYEMSNARISGLIGTLPDMGRDIYKAVGRGSTGHMRVIKFFMTLVIALNMHVSFLLTETEYARRKRRQSRPPAEMMLRAMINVRNSSFQIPDVGPDGRKIGRARQLPV